MNKTMMLILGALGLGALALTLAGGEEQVSSGQAQDPDSGLVASWKVTAIGEETFGSFYQLPNASWKSSGTFDTVEAAETAALAALSGHGYTEEIEQTSTLPGRVPPSGTVTM